ncbi:O-methyltransferase family 3 [Emticicia oligotrophica DSM 17448]|uniref:O-methyltransferase family 3 n=1 Tax=Emticicia oligotrophica (strain DSM 17448 / CIP 109782 / MTCC 6937 / GPTSA100-15) TaxID=929562 RepID=A0ABN4AQJ2_EMTOG|nr:MULTISPECIES: O-methyltransferase [Emticicia]AFK04658.1 O-methyltransferase family 3 [Emticicia oligotrophica DSM 17448]
MEFISEELDDYCVAHTTGESELLRRLNRETHAKVLQPRMLSGHFQGRYLSMISHMIRPKNILEIGTYTGYSALCLAEGLQEDGHLLTIDVNEELEEFVRSYINESPQKDKIEFRIGNALEIIPTLKETFDLVFIDADKLNYDKYYDLVFDKVRKGGFIISDNVLWSGKVADPSKKDKDTLSIRAYNQKLQEDSRTENILLPIRDGLIIVRKL